MKRYDPDVTMSESDDGDYIKYEEYESLKASHNNLLRTIKLLDKMRHIHQNQYTKRIVEQALKEAGEM